MKKLNRQTVPNLPSHPERILQFGEGNFLRAFVDWMVQRMNQRVDFDSSIAVVQPIERGLADRINDQDGLYHLVLEGMKDGEPVRETELIHAVSRCLNPYSEFEAYQDLIESSDLRFVISNTTEAGIQWADGETLDQQPQPSFPGKMTALLYHRFCHYKGAPDKGLIVIACELIEDNGDKLKEYVLRHAENWRLGKAFANWVEHCCAFCSTLVDRIVPGFPRDTIQEHQARLGFEDNLVVVGEFYHNWVIQAPEWVAEEFPAHKAGLNVRFVDREEQREIRDQKVRVLNGAHTGAMAAAFLSGFDTVRESIEDDEVGRFMKEMVAEEIVPQIPGDPETLRAFADKILERFYNPFIRHEWRVISLNSMSKWETRVLPSLLDALNNTGQLPQRLAFSLAATIAFYRGRRGEETYDCQDNADILALYAGLWGDHDKGSRSVRELVTGVLAYEPNWKRDLTAVAGLTESVTGHLENILEQGPLKALIICQEQSTPTLTEHAQQ